MLFLDFRTQIQISEIIWILFSDFRTQIQISEFFELFWI